MYKNDFFYFDSFCFSIGQTVHIMVTKLAMPPIAFEIGSAKKTPFIESP